MSTHFNWSVQMLGSTSSSAIGQVMGLPPSFPGKFLEICQRCFLSQSKALEASAPVPLPATAKPAVLGRCGFREGLGHSGQKIRRRLAPPRPPSPSPPRPSSLLAPESFSPSSSPVRPGTLTFAPSTPTGSLLLPSCRAPTLEPPLPLGHGPLRTGVSAALSLPMPRAGSAGDHRPPASCRIWEGLTGWR